MALTENQRAQVWAIMMEAGLVPAGVEKSDFRAAVDDIDDFFDNNAIAINNALPNPYKTQASAAQKAALVGLVALRRAIADGLDRQAIGRLFD